MTTIGGLLLLEMALIVGASFFLFYKKNSLFKKEYLFLQFYLIGLFLWIGSIVFQGFIETEVAHKPGSIEFFSLQIGLSSAILFFFSEFLFSRTYKNKKHHFPLLEKIFLLFFTSLMFIIFFFPEMIATHLTMLSNKQNGITGIGPYEPAYTIFILSCILGSIINFFKRMRTAQNLILKTQFRYMLLACLIFNLCAIVSGWILPIYFDYIFLDILAPIFFFSIILSFVYISVTLRFCDFHLSAQKYATYFTNGLLYFLPLVGILNLFENQLISFPVLTVDTIGLFLITLFFWKKTIIIFDKFWNFIFYAKETNPLEEIRKCTFGFNKSIKDGIVQLSQALNIHNAQLILATENNLPIENSSKKEVFSMFIDFFKSHPTEELIQEEIEYELLNFKYKKHVHEKKSIKSEMKKYLIAAALPIVNNQKKLLGILLLEQKIDHKLFSVQEIEETKILLKNATIYIAREKNHNKIKKLLKNPKTVKKEFLNGLMHEIRNPLTIAGNVKEMISWNHLKPEDQKFIEQSQNSLNSLGKKLDRISEAFQWQNKSISLQKSSISLKALFTFILEDLSKENPLIFEQILFQIEKSKKLEKKVYNIDLYNLKKAFIEIIKNGLFFNKQKAKDKKVFVNIHEENNNLIIDFKDNGVGIDEKHWESIFDLLFVLSSSRHKSECGLGVGLTIAKGIMESHGGTLKIVKSKIGEGTTFRLTLALSETEEHNNEYNTSRKTNLN